MVAPSKRFAGSGPTNAGEGQVGVHGIATKATAVIERIQLRDRRTVAGGIEDELDAVGERGPGGGSTRRMDAVNTRSRRCWAAMVRTTEFRCRRSGIGHLGQCAY